jgi:hypothetical protein
VLHETVLPERPLSCAHCEPEDAPALPQRSVLSWYGPAGTVSYWPQWEVVSTEEVGDATVDVVLVEVVVVLEVVDVDDETVVEAVPGWHCE